MRFKKYLDEGKSMGMGAWKMPDGKVYSASKKKRDKDGNPTQLSWAGKVFPVKNGKVKLPSGEYDISEGFSVRSLTSGVPKDYISSTKANASMRSRINKDIHKLLKPTYFKLIPLDKIFNVLEKHGIVVLQEDQTEWSGFLTGGIKSTVQVHFLLGWKDSMDDEKRYQVIPNMALNLSYFKMPSGKFEVIAYVS